MMSYRICFVTHASMERHATIKRSFGLAGPLTELGHRVSICLEDCEQNREAIEQIDGVQALWFQPAGLNLERSQKAALVSEGNFDAVHICGLGFRNAIPRTASRSGVTIMDHVELESALVNAPKTRRWAQYALEAWSLKHYPAQVVASEYLQDLWRKRCTRWRLCREVLYMPFAYDRQWRNRLGQSSGQRARARFPGKKILFYMGGFHRAYGCYEMLGALEALRLKRRDVAAVLCGRGPEYQGALDYAGRQGLTDMTIMPGFVPESELMDYLAAADVLISPLQDTVADRARCPSKLYEYMVTNQPIVTCRIGENGHALGDSGYYYQPGNQASMTSALERALDGKRPGYQLEEHSWLARAQLYTQWLDRMDWPARHR
jgi:glycosyltransferase involved in cell wall biosynthesis